MDLSIFLVLRVICIICFALTLLWGIRMYRDYRQHLTLNAEGSASSADTSGQRLYNTTQMVAVWLFCVLLFGMMSLIL